MEGAGSICIKSNNVLLLYLLLLLHLSKEWKASGVSSGHSLCSSDAIPQLCFLELIKVVTLLLGFSCQLHTSTLQMLNDCSTCLCYLLRLYQRALILFWSAIMFFAKVVIPAWTYSSRPFAFTEGLCTVPLLQESGIRGETSPTQAII